MNEITGLLLIVTLPKTTCVCAVKESSNRGRKNTLRFKRYFHNLQRVLKAVIDIYDDFVGILKFV